MRGLTHSLKTALQQGVQLEEQNVLPLLYMLCRKSHVSGMCAENRPICGINLDTL